MMQLSLDSVSNIEGIDNLIDMYFDELGARGLINPERLDFSSFCAAVVYSDGNLVSFIIFAAIGLKPGTKFDPNQIYGNVVIMAAYTLPKYRKYGIYNTCFEWLVTVLRKEGKYVRIVSGFNARNKISMRAQVSQGRDIYERGPNGYRTQYWLEPTWVQRAITKIRKFLFDIGVEPVYKKDMFKI